MDFLQPSTLDEALATIAERPDAVPIAGGTDLLVDLNFDRRRPDAVLDLGHVPELRAFGRDNGSVRIGATATFSELIAGCARELPGLAIASRTVGSPQIRNRGTVGGNLGTASPAGDALPPLVAAGAQVEVASRDGGRRMVDVGEWIVRPRHSALAPGELIVAVHVPVARGPQQFSKIGTRNAMVIAVASFALALDVESRTVRTCIGSAGPTMLRATEAEHLLVAAIGDWHAAGALDEVVVERFGELAAAAARPIDDVRGSAAYRRHAVGVMARRTLRWTFSELRAGWGGS